MQPSLDHPLIEDDSGDEPRPRAPAAVASLLTLVALDRVGGVGLADPSGVDCEDGPTLGRKGVMPNDMFPTASMEC